MKYFFPLIASLALVTASHQANAQKFDFNAPPYEQAEYYKGRMAKARVNLYAPSDGGRAARFLHNITTKLELAAEQGNQQAATELYQYYFEELWFDGFPNDKKYHKYLARAHELGDKAAAVKMARNFFSGFGTESDILKGYKYLEIAKIHDRSAAHALLGDLFHSGIGEEKDFDKAIGHYLKAIELKPRIKERSPLYYKIALLYLSSDQADRIPKFKEFLEHAVRKGNKEATHLLINLERTGEIYPKNEESAYKKLERIANRNYIPAMYDYAVWNAQLLAGDRLKDEYYLHERSIKYLYRPAQKKYKDAASLISKLNARYAFSSLSDGEILAGAAAGLVAILATAGIAEMAKGNFSTATSSNYDSGSAKSINEIMAGAYLLSIK